MHGFHELFHQSKFDVQWWQQDLPVVHQWFPLDIVHSGREIGPKWPVPPVVVCLGVPTVPQAQIAMKLSETALEAHKECNHFEVSDHFPAVCSIFQNTAVLFTKAIFLGNKTHFLWFSRTRNLEMTFTTLTQNNFVCLLHSVIRNQ